VPGPSLRRKIAESGSGGDQYQAEVPAGQELRVCPVFRACQGVQTLRAELLAVLGLREGSHQEAG
jgi:hypothetical protein